MKISLYVVARNEAANLVACLAPLQPLFDDIVVVDDASTDGTAEIVSSQLHIEPLRADSARLGSLAAVRNLAIARTRHPWVLKLDADERLSPDHARQLLELPEPPGCHGYFWVWRTFMGDTVFDDYKLPLARRSCMETGLVHENLQQDMRRQGQLAGWLPEVALLHYPDPARTQQKAVQRRERLAAALRREPAWYRHHWFLGYMDFQAGDFAAAGRHLDLLRQRQPRDFPVECLNACMVLADIAARRGDAGTVTLRLREALQLHGQVRDDFEVRVNFRMQEWFEQALRDTVAGNLDAVRAYRFAS